MIKTKPDPVTPLRSAPREREAFVTPSQAAEAVAAAALRVIRRHRERVKANAAKTLAETVAADG